MKKQRGIADLWMVAIGLLLLAGITLAVSLVWTRYIASIDKAGYDRGVAETGRKYAERDNKVIEARDQRIAELTKAIRDSEEANRAKIAAVDAARQQEIANAKAQAARDVAAIRAGTLRLRDPGKTFAAGPVATGGSAAGQAGSSPGQCDATAGTQLSVEAGEFLYSLLDEADDVVSQLGAAQQVIRLDLELCK